MAEHRFGVSTHLFHESRLTRDHLVHIAAHGFDAIELFATRSHFDYRDERAIDTLGEWLADTRLELHSMHAPIFEGLRRGQWIGPFSNACGDETRRAAAIAETAAALEVARRLPYRFLVVHMGLPAGAPQAGSENRPEAARRSLEEIGSLAAAVGVRVAVEVIPNLLSTPPRLVELLEEQLEGLDLGICLDYGHAHLMGDLGEAIEAISGHLWTTHVHDNHGRDDEHLVPFGGTINWDAAMMATQKIGYDGMLMLEVADTGDPIDVLRRSAAARERLEKTFVTF
ncbi:MAG: sugar phosphate isomerase/epimerase [Acidobacteria bacterium]|nr:sugar phosphate isomerase/epimerase [Acidobacteriota bacterium]